MHIRAHHPCPPFSYHKAAYPHCSKLCVERTSLREGNSNRRCRISNFIAHTPPHIFFSFNESANAPHKNTRNNADFAAAQAEEAALKAAEDKKRKRTGGELSPFFFGAFLLPPSIKHPFSVSYVHHLLLKFGARFLHLPPPPP